MSQTFSIIESNWQGVDEEPAFASHNLPESGGIFNAINEPEYMGTLPTWSTYSTSEGAGPAVTVDGNNVSIPISWVGDGRRVIIDIQNLTVGENYIFEFDWSKQGSSEECYLSNGIYRSTLNGKNLGNVIRKEIYGHVVLLVNRQSDIKYISFATNSMSYISAGDTMVVSNFTVYSNKMLFNRLSELEQGNSESIKNIRQQFTHFEKNTGRNNIDVVSSFGNDLGIDNNLSYFDRILTAEITDGNIVSGSRMVGYKQVSHGDIFSVIAHCNNATNTVTAIGLYFTTEKPAIGNTGLVTQYIKFIDGGIEDAIVEWVAPDNGYLVVRHVPRNTTTCILYKKEDFSRFINSYLEEIYALTLEAKKGINANADDAEHFGEVVSHSSSNYGVSEYIDIEGAKFIRMQVRYSTSDIFNSSLIGSVFYDSSKNPISVASMNNKAALQYWGSSIVSVPDTAKYIRVTEYLVDSPNISIYKTLESDFVKDIKELKNITGGLSANVFKESNFEPFAFINNRGVQITDGVIVSTEKNFNWTASYCYAKKGDVFKFEIEDSTGIVAAFYMFDEAPITVNKIGRLIKDVYYPTLANQLITVDVEIQEKGYFCMFMYRS